MTRRDPQRTGPAPWPAQTRTKALLAEADAMLAAMIEQLDPAADPATLTDAQLDARRQVADAALRRAEKLYWLRRTEQGTARIYADLAGEANEDEDEDEDED
jgi:hypothetical protein